MDGKPAAREETRGEPRNTRFLRNGGVGSADSPEIRKDSQTEKRSSASKIETREASNDGPGFGNSRGKKHGSRQTRPEWVGRSVRAARGYLCMLPAIMGAEQPPISHESVRVKRSSCRSTRISHHIPHDSCKAAQRANATHKKNTRTWHDAPSARQAATIAKKTAAERRIRRSSSAGRVEHFRAANGKREAVDAGGQQFGPTLEE